jgi:hypothetical protein
MQAMIARHITLHDISMAILTKISVLIVNKYKEKREIRKEAALPHNFSSRKGCVPQN